jgi:hypothetical protein
MATEAIDVEIEGSDFDPNIVCSFSAQQQVSLWLDEIAFFCAFLSTVLFTLNLAELDLDLWVSGI